ncbi:D-alanyl-D-alanine carboxypeptidase [Synechococcus phage Ssp-JY42]|nr:L-alanyl-D-glutamate peptidase [Synechococcus phage Yong-M4-211]
MASRSLDDLHPHVAAKARAHISACKAEGIDLLVTCTYRDPAEQARLFAQGRTTPGKIVTNARPGQSFHEYRVAYDVVPMRAGKPVWGTKGADLALWTRVGELGEAQGLEWAGRWVRFREYPHFQFTGGRKLAHFQAGGSLAA